MDLDTIQNKVQKQVYKSARHFLADIKWIYHNSHILFEDNERKCILRMAVSILYILGPLRFL